MRNPARQHAEPLSPDVLRLVEGIARMLAREDHEREIATGRDLGSDIRPAGSPEPSP